jgi:sulfite exporter TauE/SafE
MTAALLVPLATGSTMAVLFSAHCTVMCGPVALATHARSGFAGSLLYAAGRLVTYSLLGLMAGSVGQALFASPWAIGAQVVVSVGFALALIFTALRQLGLVVPKGTVSIGRAPRRNFIGSVLARVAEQPFLLGSATALIPCAALFTAVSAAAALGSPLQGVVAMATFALLSSLALVFTAQLLGRLGGKPMQRRVLAGLMLAGALVALWRPWGLLTTQRARCHVSASDFAFAFPEID